MLLQAVAPGCLPLIIVRQYYSLSFDWWQQLHFAETNYMPKETFQGFNRMLWFGVKLKPKRQTKFARLHLTAESKQTMNHKQVLWFKLKSLLKEEKNG